MDSETWLEKAERLRCCITREIDSEILDEETAAAREQMTIALWLRREFTHEPEDEAVVPFE